MRKITKNHEPKSWEEYRHTPGAKYSATPDLINSLYEEQGYICAYCERRIPCLDAEPGTPGIEDHRIDHLRTQNASKITGINTDLVYSNMVICCPGNISRDGEANYHCDKKKHNANIKISPLNGAMMSTIQFTPNGIIKSTDLQLDKEINENLNLNQSQLVANRKATWLRVAKGMHKQNWRIGTINHLIQVWDSKHEININGKKVLAYRPFCSMVLYMLRKKQRVLTSKKIHP